MCLQYPCVAGAAEVKGFELKGMKIEDMLNIKASSEP
jgi:hypothetical protein